MFDPVKGSLTSFDHHPGAVRPWQAALGKKGGGEGKGGKGGKGEGREGGSG